jgi:hypothetical protein
MGIVVFAVVGAALALVLFYALRKGREPLADDWDNLVSRIQPVPFAPLEKVALEHLQPNGRQTKLETTEIWDLIGGWDGLEKMQHNADLMIRLAAYVRIWNFEEAVIVAERMREDSIVLKRALFRIRFHLMFPKYRLRTPFYVDQAAAAYYLMTRRLLSLYETNQFVLYPKLIKAF